jgi:methylphosphotriester-DNA--protein-cysteine methyltransferase
MLDPDVVVKRAVEYIEAHLSGTLSVKEIAAALKLDPGNVDCDFRQVVGVTIKKYVDGRLMERVDSLLAGGERCGYRIATELGFSSDRAFYRWFKRVYHITFRKLKSRRDLTSGESRRGDRPRPASK